MEAKQVAAQLRCPNGEEAVDVAKQMNKTNLALNQKCIGLMQLQAGDKVLEIGPGNGAFAEDVVNTAEHIRYFGLDWSREMVDEALRINQHLIESGKVQFQQGNSAKQIYHNNQFDKVFTVHTLYFWENPMQHLAEIKRVLQPTGLFGIAFGHRDFMQDLPFTAYGFELYDAQSVSNLLEQVGFTVIEQQLHVEHGVSNTGDMVDKRVEILICKLS